MESLLSARGPGRYAAFSSELKFPKNATVAITSNLAICAWSIKCRRKKLIEQFGWKSRDERFKHNWFMIEH